MTWIRKICPSGTTHPKKRFYGVFHAHEFIGMITSVDGENWEKAKEYILLEKKSPA